MKTKKTIRFILIPVAFLMLLACTAKSSNIESSVDTTVTASIPVIYETDMTLDVDDVGAMAVLHAVYGTKYYEEEWDVSGRLRDDEGKPKFTWSLQKGHRGYAAPKNDAQIEQEIERLMTLAP